MSSKKYDLLVFIGRFQPVHIGHMEVIQTALKQSHQVLVLVGSPNSPRTSKNPWTFPERRAMIDASLPLTSSVNVAVKPLPDQAYNDQKWAASVQDIVMTHARVSGITKAGRIGLIGHSKDESSYYLKMFPQWDLVEHTMNEEVSATDLRSLMFEGKSTRFLAGVLPSDVLPMVEDFMTSPAYELLVREHEMIKKYRKAWAAAPYAPTFVTTDAVVVQSGHILLIQRDAAPGEGLWALPGGFLNQGEYIEDGMIRELREETKLKVPTPVLKGSIKRSRVFDDPKRSLRGRTITHAYLIELPPGELPLVKGSDDARYAKWVPIASILENEMFEDHYHIIQVMLGSV